MTWISLANVGDFIRGFLHGSADEVLNTFTDAEVIRFKDNAYLLPWENHLKEEAYSEINKTETAAPWCITALKMAIVEVCTKSTTLVKEALPPKISVPKS